MKLTPFQHSLAKSFALGTLFGLAVIFIAGRFFSTDGLVGFREAERHGLERARAEVVSYASAVDAAAPAVVNVHTAKRVREAPLRNDPFYRHFFDQPDIPRERLELEMVARAHVLRSDLQNLARAKAAEIVQLVGGDPKKAPLLIQWLNRQFEDFLDRYTRKSRHKVEIPLA